MQRDWDRERGGRTYDEDRSRWGGDYNRDFERGRFVGRGPRGYARSDDRIREDVCDRLTDHPEIDASDIDVRVDNGVVTLSGMVDDRWQRREAEDLAETVSGVRDVQNSIRWGRQGAGTAASRVGGATTGAFGRSQVRATMDVVGADGDKIGEVKEVRDNDFLVDRPASRDVYAPFGAIKTFDGDRIMLNIRADQVDETNWASPALIGGTATGERMQR